MLMRRLSGVHPVEDSCKVIYRRFRPEQLVLAVGIKINIFG